MRYAPCRSGLHVCGIDYAADEFVTVANVPGVTRQRFDDLRREHALPDGVDPDLVVDFRLDGDIVADFGIRRQSLAALT